MDSSGELEVEKRTTESSSRLGLGCWKQDAAMDVGGDGVSLGKLHEWREGFEVEEDDQK